MLKENASHAKKVVRFLAFVNQSDWRAKQLLKLIDHIRDDAKIKSLIKAAESDFTTQNNRRSKNGKPLIPESDLAAIKTVDTVTPSYVGVIDAADNWVIEIQKEFGRLPNDNEWNRFESSPLDGMICMSYALQWRYNFKQAFGIKKTPKPPRPRKPRRKAR